MAREKTGIFLDSIIAPEPLDSKAFRKAQLIVASYSSGVEDCTLLLDMLGLNSPIDESS